MLIGNADTCPEIEYASGFRAADPVVFLQKGCDKYLVVPQLELGRARRLACHTKPGMQRRRSMAEMATGPARPPSSGAGGQVEVLTPEALGVKVSGRKRVSEWALKLLQRLNIRVLMVSPLFPHGVAKRLERAGIHITVAAAGLFPKRAVKTADELRKIRESQQAAVIAMRTAVSMIAGSEIDSAGYLRTRGKRLTSEQVQRAITKVLLDHNSFCKGTIVAGGAQAADPHEPGQGPLRAHEAIVIDIFPQHLVHGYWGDLTRTVVKGSPPPSLKKMYYAVKAAHNAALNRVKAGVKCATVHRSAAQEFTRREFKTAVVDRKSVGFIHGTGHGVGLTIHEAPYVSASDRRLRSGNVITIEPGLYYPGKGGIRIEDTIVVTRTGWRYLVPCEKKFEV